jgi:hypothetical protein
VIEVWSPLFPSTAVGKRSYRNTVDLIRDLSDRMNPEIAGLITTDGFKFFERVIGRVFGPACVFGQVIKTRRSDRVVKVERRAVKSGDLRHGLAIVEVQQRGVKSLDRSLPDCEISVVAWGTLSWLFIPRMAATTAKVPPCGERAPFPRLGTTQRW